MNDPTPQLTKALKAALAAIEEATDIMHYEDGQPVTALEGWEIERMYVALCSVMVEVTEALEAAENAAGIPLYVRHDHTGARQLPARTGNHPRTEGP